MATKVPISSFCISPTLGFKEKLSALKSVVSHHSQAFFEYTRLLTIPKWLEATQPAPNSRFISLLWSWQKEFSLLPPAAFIVNRAKDIGKISFLHLNIRPCFNLYIQWSWSCHQIGSNVKMQTKYTCSLLRHNIYTIFQKAELKFISGKTRLVCKNTPPPLFLLAYFINDYCFSGNTERCFVIKTHH